ncbi:alpha/beta hydrolase [Bacillus mojavensis]|uniref:alpha/beta hydrolase n=1 Tax=Bacillus mojavensis TaxID=72360 RepID=UPI0004753D45|nr:alpha/beta hydrolase [Bacillus mojavensis]MDR4226009.1 alpha/beta hydrolase [Bacillus mojavensis]MEC3588690.1 alpha/beta hydrolase [Bacillus mojavensis]MEC5244676.1 alpha/beta hydrolase [Bacillus mojavensis]MED0748632.1 alpha/beta hydrolase [Bacillus mojavensis]
MKHIFEKGTSDNVLLLLHGTGGNEHDLLSLGRFIDPDAHLLGVRGSVLENGMPRFFKRLSEGVFDEKDLVERTKELKDFIDEAAQTHQFDQSRVIAVGYSNGANIAASLLFHYADVLKGAILHHPMVPIRGLELPDMTGLPVFIGAGKYDPLCTKEESEELHRCLLDSGASASVFWQDGGHQLTQHEAEQARQWYKDTFQ